MKNDQYQEVDAAIAKVREMTAALRGEHDALCSDITATEAELDRQMNAYLPPEELKGAILEMVKASGDRYAAALRSAIADFARHRLGDSPYVPIPVRQSGKPMTYAAVEIAITGERMDYQRLTLLSRGKVPAPPDALLVLLFGDALCARLREVMADISPNDLGYAQIDDKDIGCGMTERRALILKLGARLEELRGRRDDVRGKLTSLGYQFPKPVQN